MPIAQLPYEGEGTWTRYFGDRYGKWTVYFDFDTNQPINLILDEMVSTRTASFGAESHNRWVEPSAHIKKSHKTEDRFCTTRRDVITWGGERAVRNEQIQQP